MKPLNELKVSTLKRKHKEIIKQIGKASENGNYDKLDELTLQRNKIEVALEINSYIKENNWYGT